MHVPPTQVVEIIQDSAAFGRLPTSDAIQVMRDLRSVISKIIGEQQYIHPQLT